MVVQSVERMVILSVEMKAAELALKKETRSADMLEMWLVESSGVLLVD